MKRLFVVLAVAGAVTGAVFSTWLQQRAMAARNSGGTYSLPSGNPVATHTTITSTWANNTLSDIGTELTNSLDRSGRGAMLAPLQLSSGTVSAPGLTFSSEPTTGLYRAGSGDIRLGIGASMAQKWTSSGTNVNGGLTATSNVGIGTTSPLGLLTVGTGGISDANMPIQMSAPTSGDAYIGANKGSGYGAFFGYSNGGTRGTGAVIANYNDDPIYFFTNNTTQLGQWDSGGLKTGAGGLTIGSSGTSISASYGHSYSFGFGAQSANTCSSSTQTLTGVSVGGACYVSVDWGANTAAWSDCYVSTANSVVIRLCQLSTANLGTLSYRVRVFQP